MAPPLLELEPNRGWVNTDRPLTFAEDLAGHVVLLYFFNGSRIACAHTNPDIAFLLKKWGSKPFAVIGVHSAKYDAERDRRVVADIVGRMGITHPVVVDDNFRLWKRFQAETWPHFVLVDPSGAVVGGTAGEGNVHVLDRYIQRLFSEADDKRTLAAESVSFSIPEDTQRGALGSPSAVLAQQPSTGRDGYLFVSDARNDRVVVATFPDEYGRSRAVDVYGGVQAGGAGKSDGAAATGAGAQAQFRDPRGMAYDPHGGRLFIADRGNHAIRQIDIADRRVTTLVGDGTRGRDLQGGKSGRGQALASPFDVAFDPERNRVYASLMGQHQIWEVELSTTLARPIAGCGTEGVYEGLGRAAMEASFAHPAGIAISSDNRLLYIVDAEGGAVRRLHLDDRVVRTIAGHEGTSVDDESVLREFGDADGHPSEARFQRPLAISLWPTKLMDATGDTLLICDSYNGKIKRLDPTGSQSNGTPRIEGWHGNLESGDWSSTGLRLSEPAWMHMAMPMPGEGRKPMVFIADTGARRIVQIEPGTKTWREVEIAGL
ncbi:MAG: thioredoxin-like domain-containing protein [Planctomycetota bacterium]